MRFQNSISWTTFNEKMYIINEKNMNSLIIEGIGVEFINIALNNSTSSSMDENLLRLSKRYEISKDILQNDYKEYICQLIENGIISTYMGD